VSHAYALIDIASWTLHWIVQKILDIVPLVEPAPESSTPPSWWYKHYSYYDYVYALRTGNVPSSELCDRALRCLWLVLGDWVEEVGKWSRDEARSWTRVITGFVPSRYSNLAAWSGFLESVTGGWVPNWTTSLASGLARLWYLLPQSVRDGAASWPSLFAQARDDAISYIRSLYDVFTQYAYGAYYYVLTTGEELKQWYNGAHTLLDEFRVNPAAFIVARLGDTWSRLSSFDRDALIFYYNLWSLYAKTLAEFLADPLGWLYSRAERFLVERW
jgi:hypothetical protein